MFEKLRPWNWNVTDAAQSNLQEYKADQSNYAWTIDSQIIAPGYSAKVMFTPFLGILKSNKYLPIRYAPVTLEITWADAVDAVLSNRIYHADEQAEASTHDYSISQLEIFCSQIQLDSSLESS